jgi:hypothetical protein
VHPVPDPLLFFLVVPGIEPGPPDLLPRTLTTRPQRRSCLYLTLHNYLLIYFHSDPVVAIRSLTTGSLLLYIPVFFLFAKFEAHNPKFNLPSLSFWGQT